MDPLGTCSWLVVIIHFKEHIIWVIIILYVGEKKIMYITIAISAHLISFIYSFFIIVYVLNL